MSNVIPMPRGKRTANEYTTSFRHILIHNNDDVARRIAQKFSYKADVDDLLQEARVALTDATVYFDPARGVPFRAYATMVIERQLLDFVSRLMPVHIGTDADRVGIVRGKLRCCADSVEKCRKCLAILAASAQTLEVEKNMPAENDTETVVMGTDLRIKLSAALLLLPSEDRILGQLLVKGHNSQRISAWMGLTRKEYKEAYERILCRLRTILGEPNNS